MPNLKKFKAEYFPSSCEGLIMKLISFTRAAPHLQELEAKVGNFSCLFFMLDLLSSTTSIVCID